MAELESIIDPQAVNVPYQGGNDELIYSRKDGPFGRAGDTIQVHERRGTINEPTALMTVNADGEPDPHNPVRIAPAPAAEMPEPPPETEPPP